MRSEAHYTRLRGRRALLIRGIVHGMMDQGNSPSAEYEYSLMNKPTKTLLRLAREQRAYRKKLTRSRRSR